MNRLLSLAAMLCISLLFSCAPEIEPILEYPSSSGTSSSNVVVLGSCSSLSSSSSNVSVISSSSRASSSSTVIPSSSSSVKPSSSSAVSSSSSVVVQSSSSSAIAGTELCDGFVNGTKREHYGREKEQFCDTRDGKKYVYVTIGEQIWMAENLNYNVSDSKCYNNNETNCVTYGRLYNWVTAMGISGSYNISYYNPSASTKYKGVCPSSWHLPNNAEWTTLTDFVGGSSTAGTKLKARSGWSGNGNGTDDYGFSALPGGDGGTGTYFHPAGYGGSWWSATEGNASSAYNRYTGYLDADISTAYSDDKTELYSVRCLKD